MNKRTNKKIHKKYLNDVVFEISVSSIWRKRLFSANHGDKILISKKDKNELPKYISPFIVKYNLQYYVWVTDKIIDNDIYYEGGLFFIFTPKKFEKVCDYSFNNPSAI